MKHVVFDEIISIGGNCDAAHHIRRHFGITESMPMDWLILPYQGLLSLIEENFKDFIRLDNLGLWNGTRHAIQCGKRGSIYQHDFSRDPSALVNVDRIPAEFERVAEKYRRRINRFRQACQPGKHVLFVRSWREILHEPSNYPKYCIPGVPAYDFKRLLDSIETCFPDLTFKVLFVNYGPQNLDDPRALFANIRNCGDITDWTGSPGGWDEAFNAVNVSWKGQKITPEKSVENVIGSLVLSAVSS